MRNETGLNDRFLSFSGASAVISKSGSRRQTVNLPAQAFVGSNTSSPAIFLKAQFFKAGLLLFLVMRDKIWYTASIFYAIGGPVHPLPIKMGLFVEDADVLKAFLSRAEALCPVRVIDYSHAETVYGNSIRYRSFVSGLMQTPELPEDCRDDLLVNSNLVTQMLDEKGLSPYKTFESISRSC